HDGDRPAYWIDGLDIPLTHHLETVSFEEHPDRHEKIVSVAAESPFRFTHESISAGLDRAKPDAEGFHGPRIQLEAPDMPSMGLAMERLGGGPSTPPPPSNPGPIFARAGGRRRTNGHREGFAL